MFNYFETKYSFHHPFESLFTGNINFLKHPIYTGIYESKICLLGNVAGFFIMLWLVSKNFFKVDPRTISKINSLLLFSVLIISFLLNFNAFLYFLPVFIIEKFI